MELLEIKQLIPRLIRGVHTEEEARAFEHWLQTAPEADVDEIMDIYYEGLGENGFVQFMPAEFPGTIKAELSKAPIHRIHFLRRGFLRYAAAIVLLLGTVAYLYYISQKKDPVIADVESVPVKNDAALAATKLFLHLQMGQRLF